MPSERRRTGSPPDSLTDVAGLRVGRAESAEGTTGVTVVLFDAATPTVLDVRGGASCTYDTASLALDATFGRRWAIFFAGGSVFGLDAARGIRTRILELGGGHPAFRNPNPVVPISGATLFDLPRRFGPIPDYLPLGYAATERASRAPVRSGRFGAGTGATVGKYRGRARAMPGGEGSASASLRGLGRVGVLVAVNAIGAIRGDGGSEWLAGARGPAGTIVPPEEVGTAGRAPAPERGTTLVAAVVEAEVERRVLARIAGQVHAGLARAVLPVHSALDGDAVFVATTGRRRVREPEARPGSTADRLGSAAAQLTERAVRRAVTR